MTHSHTSAQQPLPLSPVEPSTTRWFAPHACVVERENRIDVWVAGTLVGSFEPGDRALRNTLLVQLSYDPVINLGKLAKAFGISSETLRQMRRVYEAEGMEPLWSRAPGGSEPTIKAALRKRVAKLLDEGQTIRQVHEKLSKRHRIGLGTIARISAERSKAQTPPPGGTGATAEPSEELFPEAEASDPPPASRSCSRRSTRSSSRRSSAGCAERPATRASLTAAAARSRLARGSTRASGATSTSMSSHSMVCTRPRRAKSGRPSTRSPRRARRTSVSSRARWPSGLAGFCDAAGSWTSRASRSLSSPKSRLISSSSTQPRRRTESRQAVSKPGQRSSRSPHALPAGAVCVWPRSRASTCTRTSGWKPTIARGASDSASTPQGGCSASLCGGARPAFAEAQFSEAKDGRIAPFGYCFAAPCGTL